MVRISEFFLEIRSEIGDQWGAFSSYTTCLDDGFFIFHSFFDQLSSGFCCLHSSSSDGAKVNTSSIRLNPEYFLPCLLCHSMPTLLKYSLSSSSMISLSMVNSHVLPTSEPSFSFVGFSFLSSFNSCYCVLSPHLLCCVLSPHLSVLTSNQIRQISPTP
jgi:hypothetical protein